MSYKQSKELPLSRKAFQQRWTPGPLSCAPDEQITHMHTHKHKNASTPTNTCTDAYKTQLQLQENYVCNLCYTKLKTTLYSVLKTSNYY